MSAQPPRTAKMQLAGFQHDGFMKRKIVKFFVLAKENSEKHGVPRYLHRRIHSISFYLIALMRLASTTPTQTAIMQSSTDRPVLAPPRNPPPSFIRFNVCRLNDENVV